MKLEAKCFAIPADKPFLRVLAGWLLEHYGGDAAAFTRMLVLLPSRRACRELREAFLAATGGKALLLPRIQPIGDMEEALPSYARAADSATPPAISPVRRLLLLTGLVQEFRKKQASGEDGRGDNVEQAAELAQQLARFIDDMAREGLSFDRLPSLVPDELAAHWQQTLEFLTIVSQAWPGILEEEGALDPVDHRNRLLAATAGAWQAQPPDTPVIAAGSTGSMPATARLLSVIARLPQGMVVLPGLDTGMSDSEWDMIGDTHPQFGLRQLLEKIDCPRRAVQSLCGGQRQERIACLRAILGPPDATSGWKESTLPLQEGLQQVHLLEADTLADEARMVAVALREVLQTPGKTAALVTPDRTLARMVAAQMRRFGIAIDDSAGRALMDTPPGCFLRLAVDMVAQQAAPAALLALLRHPLAAAGREPAECRRLSRLLELEPYMLRGIRPAPGLETLLGATRRPDVKSLLADMEAQARRLAGYFRYRAVPLGLLLEAHIAFAEWLAATGGEDGKERLWAGDDGNQLAAALAELAQQADMLAPVDPLSYGGLLETLLAGEVWRPRYGLHPRLHILSPIEARLLQFDRVILGGLNEGTWPPPAAADPWMSRPMRADFGLPPAQRGIGQSAHDLFLLAAAPEVILSRARKVEGAPAVASRWLVRLATLVAGLDADYYARMQAAQHYARGVRRLDAPQDMPALKKPEPLPPPEARPRQLNVTAVDTWLRDPYVIYARHILGLKKLDPLDEEPDAADFGQVVHKSLERFIAAWPQSLPDDAYETLLECGRAAFSEFIDRPAVACLWWPRFESMAAWIVEQERLRRPAIARVLGELKGEWHFSVEGKPFALTTRIDRIEIGKDGTLTIADYKTGIVPSKGEVERGLANQLPLEALVARHGQLQPPVAPAADVVLEYWKLAGNAAQCGVIPVGSDIAAAQQRLEELVAKFDNAATPYAAQGNPSLTLKYNDYEHLTRRQEWEAV